MIRGKVHRHIVTIGLTIIGTAIACDEPSLPTPLPPTAESAQAVHDELLFELDGNTLDEATGGEDWSSLIDPPHLPVVDTHNGSIFIGGGSKDDHDISEWQHTDGSVPDKDDLLNAAASTYKKPITGGEELILYFAADRFATNGDAQIGFWFLQNEVHLADDGTFVDPQGNPAHHKIGDILVLSNFTKGGDIGTIDVCHWAGADGAAGHIECDATPVLPQAGFPNVFCRDDDIACATINHGQVDSAWSFDPKSGPNDKYGTGAFFEGGVNATQVLGETPCFATFLVETRSSQSIDAVLKDFVLGDLSVCAPSVEVCKQCDVSLVESGGKLVVQVDVSGWACNTGNVELSVDLVDDKAGSIFDDKSIASETCVNFTKSYQPSSGSSDPNEASFSDEVTMTGTHAQAGTVSATASATCEVCGTDTVCQTAPKPIVP
jgi:hypothetical protein